MYPTLIFRVAFAVTSTLALATTAAAQVPVLVKDLGTAETYPDQTKKVAVHDGRVYFESETARHPGELGSVPVAGGGYRYEREVVPGTFNFPSSSSGPLYSATLDLYQQQSEFRIQAHFGPDQPIWESQQLSTYIGGSVSIATLGNKAYFAGGDDSSMYRVFVTNGTDSGTRAIHDASYLYPSSVSRVGDRVLFLDRQDPFVRLWSIDGSEDKAYPLATLAGQWPNVVWTGVAQGTYWFVANHSCNEITVARSGGTPASTQQRVFDMGGQCANLPEDIAIHQGNVYLGGDALVRLDFDSGAVEQLAGPCAGCSFVRLTSVDETLVFMAPSDQGGELHRLSGLGSSSPTEPVTHSGQPIVLSTSHLARKPFAVLGNRILTNCQFATCSTTGVDDSLEVLDDLVLDEQFGVADDGEHWYFSARRGFETGMWRSDGTMAGTTQLYRAPPKTMGSIDTLYARPAWIGNTLLFTGALLCDLPWVSCNAAIGRSDGTAAGTWLISPPPTWGVAQELYPLGDRLLTSMQTPQGFALVTLSSNSTNVEILAEPISQRGPILLTNDAEDPGFMLVRCTFNNLFNVCAVPTNNPTALEQLLPIVHYNYSANPIGSVNNRALFYARPSGIGSVGTVWSTGGTTATTLSLPGLPPNLTSAGQQTVVFGGSLYFTALDNNILRLWKSDGTTASLVNGPIGTISEFATGSALYFVANHDNASVLWRSDGTPEGTIPIRTTAAITDLEVVRDHVHWIEWQDWTYSYWISDGSVAGTHQLGTHPDLTPRGEIVELPDHFREDSPRGWDAIMRCESATYGVELCGIRQDGTELDLVADIAPGNRSSLPAAIWTNGEKVFLSADDGQHGHELFELRTDAVFADGFGAD